MSSFESTPTSPSSAPTAEIRVAARLLAGGQTAEAIQRLESISSAVPAYATGQVLLAKAYEAAQRWEDALDTWHRAYFLAPSSPLVQRERRRLLDAQARATKPPQQSEPPPIPQDEQGSEVAADTPTPQEIEGEVVGAPVEQPDLEETVESPTDEQSEGLEAETAGLLESDELDDSAFDDEMPEVFVRDSVPVSDALGAGVTAEIWDDEEIHVSSSVPEEPAIASPETDEDSAEPILGEADGDAAWWKQSTADVDSDTSEDVDTGWTVLSEMETTRAKEVIAEATIAAPESDVVAKTHPESEEASLADDLDSLIQQLEDAPRIRPDPNFSGGEDAFDDDEADDMVSETLARIYVAQGQYKEAADVYDKLAEQHPEQAGEFSEKAEDLRIRHSRGT